ncbi:MAG: hypothetical protein JOZ05_11120 [Acetobacteraceae bacterium]|nr:hypothetical protein [Acetobacteraceae bacterium]
MALPPPIVIHGLEHARLALAPGRPVTLLSAPAAGLYAGCGWWRAVIAAAGCTGPDLLDCADAPGRALEALSLGCRGLVLRPCPAWDSVAERAAAQGALLLRERPPALDLAEPGASRRIAAWLGFG